MKSLDKMYTYNKCFNIEHEKFNFYYYSIYVGHVCMSILVSNEKFIDFVSLLMK